MAPLLPRHDHLCQGGDCFLRLLDALIVCGIQLRLPVPVLSDFLELLLGFNLEGLAAINGFTNIRIWNIASNQDASGFKLWV